MNTREEETLTMEKNISYNGEVSKEANSKLGPISEDHEPNRVKKIDQGKKEEKEELNEQMAKGKSILNKWRYGTFRRGRKK